MKLSLKEAQKEFLNLLDRTDPDQIGDFLDWINETIVFGEYKGNNNQFLQACW